MSTPTTTTASPVTPANESTEEWELQRDALKGEADDFYKAKDFKKSIAKYTEAITLDPGHILLYSNRSAAYLNNNEKSRALKDAQKCVELDKGWFKGHNRLAAALYALGRLGAAKSSYNESLRLCGPDVNKIASKGLEDVTVLEKKRMEEEKGQREAALLSAKSSGGPRASQNETTEEISSASDSKKEGVSKPVTSTVTSTDPTDEEDDLLADFFSNVVGDNSKDQIEATEEKIQHSGPSKIRKENVDLEAGADQINRLVLVSNYEWKNLNPFAVLAISHTATEEEVARRYKALSLLVHPDKCREPHARDAFEQIRKANAQLNDSVKRKHTIDLINAGRKNGKKHWEAEQKRLHTSGLQPEETLEEAQEKAVMKLFAEIETKRRDVERRKRNQEKRERDLEDAEIEKLKAERDFDQNWKKGERLDKRIGNWRDFSHKKKKK